MNKKIIEGLSSIAEGINLIVEGLSASVETSVSVNEVADLCPEPVKVSEKTLSDKSDKDIEPAVMSSSEYTEEELGNMTYNDIKKLAKELGISATGNRKELVKKILSSGDAADSEEDEVTEVTPEPVKEVKKSAPKSFKKKVEEPEPEVEEPDDSEDEEELDPTEAKVKEATEDMSDDEIRELLEDVGVSAKGKRQSLISKLVKAVEDGLIDIDGEDEEAETPETPESDEVAESDVTEGMTKARRKAYEELCDETSEAFESDEITRADLIEFINAFNGTDDKFKKVSDEELLTKYLELSAMLVDDEGNVVEEGAYTINDEPYCCGHPLHYDEDGEKFICECCGSEYEAE